VVFEEELIREEISILTIEMNRKPCLSEILMDRLTMKSENRIHSSKRLREKILNNNRKIMIKNNRSKTIFNQIQKEFSQNPEEVIDKYMFLSCFSVLKGVLQ